ncbi:glucan biosynthesis protein C [Novosphingobium sp. PhB165]|uniref:acyltransferase family protein n=1 Tax=Novosphingobium sp. PhB165 TaxID=2485105 RepID=UPI0010E53336|nr:acyltransferase family protein [Novosphingobium sp. PhB165]TCM20626.1 glucan biosynthesis protein C [Novosphingobium sp. PhB165]
MPVPPAREHHWDAVRGSLMLLIVPYHVALAYRPGREWMVPVRESDPLMTVIAEVIHVFQMPAFFLLAGYFSALLLARRDARSWLHGRLLRIGVPLVVSLVTIVPVLNLLAASVRGGEHLTGLQALYPTNGTVLRHLWFMVVLLYLQSLTALACTLHPPLRTLSVPQRWDEQAAKRFTLLFIVAGIGIAAYCGLVLGLARTTMSETGILQGLFRLADFVAALPFYVVGMALHRAPAVRAAFDRPRIVVMVLTLLATGVAVYADHYQVWPMERVFGAFAALGWAQSLVGLARTFFHRESAAIRIVADSSLVIYLFHLPIAIALTILGYRVQWGVWVEWSLISAATFLAAFAIWLAIRRVPVLNFLFSGVVPPRGEPNAPRLAVAQPEKAA